MPLVVYSALRLLLLGLTLLVGWATGLGGWLLVVVAAFAAWALSYVLLARPRDAAALWLADRSERRRTSGARFSPGVEADALAEDAEARAAGATDPAGPPAQPGAPDRVAGEQGQAARPSPSSTP